MAPKSENIFNGASYALNVKTLSSELCYAMNVIWNLIQYSVKNKKVMQFCNNLV